MIDLDFRPLLGKKLYSDEAARCFAELNAKPEINDEGDRTYCEFPDHGLALVTNAVADIETIQFYAQEEGFSPFTGQLPFGLGFTLDQTAVCRLLGKPTSSGGSVRDPALGGVVPAWVRYDRPENSLHVEFGKDDRGQERITMVTLMSAARAASLGA